MSTVETSLIAENARDVIPIAWDALKTASTPTGSVVDPPVDTGIFQRKLDAVHLELFGEILSDVIEAALDRLVLEYAGKIYALKLIPAALDFWAAQTTSVTASGGRNESKQYTDRAAQLRELRKILLEETRSMWSEVSILLPGSQKARRSSIPRVAQVGESTTPDPYDFEPAFEKCGIVPGTGGTL
jgi:hypothetical protein